MNIKLYEENLDGVFKVKKGELVVVCSRPAIGKTLFLTTLSSNFLKNNLPFRFFIFDSDKQSLISKINTSKNLKDENVLISSVVDEGCLTKESLIDKISNEVSVILIDGLQLLTIDGLNSTINKLKFLKEVATSKNVAVIVTSQIGRKFEKVKPSGKLTSKWLIDSNLLNVFINQKFVDKVAFLDKPYTRLNLDDFSLNNKNCNKVDFITVKNNGATLTTVELALNTYRFN